MSDGTQHSRARWRALPPALIAKKTQRSRSDTTEAATHTSACGLEDTRWSVCRGAVQALQACATVVLRQRSNVRRIRARTLERLASARLFPVRNEGNIGRAHERRNSDNTETLEWRDLRVKPFLGHLWRTTGAPAGCVPPMLGPAGGELAGRGYKKYIRIPPKRF
jgi:hypothetical protein